MGFFSWKTADTKTSIRNSYTSNPTRRVYLLQPNGKEPIEEINYEGYGVFGGIDAYEWLARNNLSGAQISDLEAKGGGPDTAKTKEILRSAGINLEMGSYYIDTKDGNKAYTVFDPILAPIYDQNGPVEIIHLNVAFGEKLKQFDNLDANELIESGRFKEVSVPNPQTPLKFSTNKNAVYEALPASKNCPNQGFF